MHLFSQVVDHALQIERLPVFWKHRSNRLYPSWAYILPTMMLRLPFSFVEGVVWTAFTYWVIGFAPTASRSATISAFAGA